MARFQIPALLIEFNEGGNTIWVHNRKGTVLRIQCSGKIVVQQECENIVAHSDMQVQGDIKICVPT